MASSRRTELTPMTTIPAFARESIRFRPETPGDLPFLRHLYGTTREEEMRRAPWPEEQTRIFLDHQFHAQHVHYVDAYPECAFLVIEMGGEAIGRLYVDRGPADIEIVDIALLPHYRGKGIGRVLLQEILDEGARSNKSVTIYVESFNPARHLYDRLGFQHVDDNGVYHRLVWSPPVR